MRIIWEFISVTWLLELYIFHHDGKFLLYKVFELLLSFSIYYSFKRFVILCFYVVQMRQLLKNGKLMFWSMLRKAFEINVLCVVMYRRLTTKTLGQINVQMFYLILIVFNLKCTILIFYSHKLSGCTISNYNNYY